MTIIGDDVGFNNTVGNRNGGFGLGGNRSGIGSDLDILSANGGRIFNDFLGKSRLNNEGGNDEKE